MRWLKASRGDTLVEVVFAIAILASVLTTAYHMSTESFNLGIDSREHIQAINVAQQQAEELRWYADQVMAAGTTLATAIKPPCISACSMQGSPTPSLTSSSFDCSVAVAAGCVAEIQTVNDIAIDPHSATPGATYPEIDERITVTWPSTLQGSQACLSGGNNCESVSIDERLADTTNYAPLDCSVAGTPGCSASVGGVGVGGAGTCPVGTVGSPPNCLPQYSIISPISPDSEFPGTVLSIQVGNTIAGDPVYLLHTDGTLVGSAIAAGSTYTFTETYPSGTWKVEACPTTAITAQCSGVLTVTQKAYTLNVPLYEYLNPTWWFYTTAPYSVEPGGTDPSYIYQGTIGYLAPFGSNRPNLIPLYRFYNIISGEHYYSTSNANPDPTQWVLEQIQGYLSAFNSGGTCPAGTTQLYRWNSPGPIAGDGEGHYLTTVINPGLSPAVSWSNDDGGGGIGCIFTTP